MENVDGQSGPITPEDAFEIAEARKVNPILLGASVFSGFGVSLDTYKSTIGSQPNYKSFVHQAEGGGFMLGGLVAGIAAAKLLQETTRTIAKGLRRVGEVAMSVVNSPAADEQD